MTDAKVLEIYHQIIAVDREIEALKERDETLSRSRDEVRQRLGKLFEK